MIRHLIVSGIIIILLVVGLSGCVENRIPEGYRECNKCDGTGVYCWIIKNKVLIFR